MKTLTVIDTFGFFFRNYFALPRLTSSDGFPTGLLTGFINFISTLNKEHSTDYILFALDSKGKTFRHQIDPVYKANRPPAPEDLLKQLPVAIEWIKGMEFKQLEFENYEADDVIASIVNFAKKEGIKVKIVSHDKDLYQLIDDGKVVMYDPVKKIEIDEEKCKEKYGVYPNQIADYLSITGDSSDNIPGVKGIGAKGAVTLLNEFKSVEDIYENIEKVERPRTKKLLLESKENALLSKQLVQLHNELIPACNLEEFSFPNHNPILKIADELMKYDLKAILKRAGVNYENKQPEKEQTLGFEYILLDTKEKLFDVINSLKDDSIIAFDTETDSLDSKKANIIGFSFAADEEKAYYVPIAHYYLGVGEQISKEDAEEALNILMSHKIAGQNLKYDLAILYNNFNFKQINVFADTMIMSWLLNPELSAGLDNMAKRYFNHTMVKFKDMVKKGENFSNVELGEACRYAAEDAWMTLKLFNFFKDKLSTNLQEEAEKVEYPFIHTLLNMEHEGIKIDIDFFKQSLCEVNENINNLTKEIYKLTDSEFNINSTQQLGVILFEKLQLKAGKKTKTGYSTDEKVLTSLMRDHPVIKKLLEYREIYKLKSTYIDPLLKLAQKNENHRIHTSFLQTGTATGRLSSKNPNLQNIPVRTELGRKIREGFIAKEGCKLIGIDYSQIELRLLAHFSRDGALIRAFNEDKDIHLETAVKIFGEEAAKEKRNIAKSINFGLLYGMGSRKLAQTINVTQKEAKEYIQSYFESFPTVKSYIETIQEEARGKGYVETLLKRRRYFDFENARPMQQAGFLRESVNTVFQGSAADLIKLSMNKLENTINKNEAKMLLQIHDELIFEVKEEIAENFAGQAKEIMETIYQLHIPLKTSVSIGDNWGELK